jgi:hypothetical protein
MILILPTTTIDIFEKKHPDCIRVFVFDQLLAHTSHGEGALNPFDINLNNRGKKGILKDTYYPPECTIPELQGQVHHLYIIDNKGNKANKGVKTIL